MKMKRFLTFIFISTVTMTVHAQREKLELNKGNEAYRDSAFSKALERYDEALETDGDLAAARFNRANAMVRLSAKTAAEAENLEDDSLRTVAAERAVELNKKAASDFESIAKLAETDEDRNKARFNQGNAHLIGGELDESITAYKEALRIDPEDDAARYNLAYAQHLKKQQEQQQDQEQDQEQEQDQDQDQDQNDEQKDQDRRDNQNQNEQEEQRPDQLTKEEAEKLLEAMMQREKDLQEQVDKKRHKATRTDIEKDW